MIKPGKACSQPMKANYTGETDINVRKYFWLTFVFNGLKTSLNLCLSSCMALKNIFKFQKLEECLTLNTFKGGQSSWIDHACTIGYHFISFHQVHMQRTSMVGSKHKLCRNFMVACKASGAREHGRDSKHEASSGRTNNARKWVDESVWAVQLVEHTGRKVAEEKWSCWKKAKAGRSTRPPRPVGPGRLASPI
jgi:hypothetical protein